MKDLLLSNEPIIRLAVFAGMLAAMAVIEVFAPRREACVGRSSRWPGNMALVVIDSLLVRFLFPVTAVAMALAAEAHGWGLLNVMHVPVWLAVPLGVVVLDLAIYAQHVLFHAVPMLWRLHRVHHADLEFDVTTGVRFHPIEILLSMVIKFAVIVGFGVPAVAVLIFEVMLNATSMFNHANIGIPIHYDRVLRWFVVTPDMHRVHHSVIIRETNSNFGFNLPWWDRLFGTYRDQPEAGHTHMMIGVEQFRDPADLRIDKLLLQPFRASSTGAAGGTMPAKERAQQLPSGDERFNPPD